MSSNMDISGGGRTIGRSSSVNSSVSTKDGAGMMSSSSFLES